MSPTTKLAGFAAALAALFGGAALAGGAIDPDRGNEETVMSSSHASPTHATTDAMPDHGGAADSDAAPAGGDAADHAAAPARDDAAAGHGSEHGAPAGAEADAVRGLAVADDGLRVALATPELTRGRQQRIAFRIERDGGAVVRDFDVTHERRMHLIVVRRDLTGFQHLHPALADDGTWSATATLPEAGSYRLFVDFSHDGAARTLASDLRVDGPADLRDLPAPAAVATSDGGDRVALADSPVRAGAETTLRFEITRDGAPVRVEPYLGASGHLVALREGDLAFLHVHPSGDGVEFATTFPSPGRYRLFLQYKVDGEVRTVAFTRQVAG